MKRNLILTSLLVLLVTASACAPTGKAQARKEAPPRKPMAKAECERKLDELLPGLGAEAIPDREKPQQTLEKLCFEAGRPGAETERKALCEAMCARLDPKTTKTARVWMLRQLERISRDESVSAVAKLLDEQDIEVRDLARRVLQNNPSKGAAAALRAELEKTPDPAWQVAVLNALGARRDEPAVPQIIKLAGSKNDDVAAATVAALGDIGNAAALAHLETQCDALAKASPSKLRGMAADALLRCADQLVAQGQKKRAGTAYDKLLAWGDAAPLQVRMAALRGAVAARGAEMLPKLLVVVADEKADNKIRALAAGLTKEAPGSKVTKTLTDTLAKSSPTTQVFLLNALAERSDAAARPAVVETLKSGHPDVRISALKALTVLGDKSSAIVLARAAADADGAERDAARKSLARLRGSGIDDALIADLKGAAAPVRVELIRGLAARRYAPAVPVLFGQASAPDEVVRIAAFNALGELGTKDDVAALVKLLPAAQPEAVRAAAEDAVVAVCNRIEDAPKRADPVLAMWETAGTAGRPAVVRVLGRLGGAAALEKIRAACKSGQPELVDAAVRALAKWPSAEVLDDLLAVAQHSSDKAHKVLALQGYVRLVGLPSDREPQTTFDMYKTAMALADRPEDKKLVLGGLANVRSLDALKMVEGYLIDSSLKSEAEIAVASIAQLVGAQDPISAKAALEQVLAQTTTENTKKRAEQALEAIKKSEGAITTWQFAGPYFQDGKDFDWVFENAFPPEETVKELIVRSAPIDIQWKPLAVTTPNEPWNFDLTKLDTGANRCLYVRAAVYAEQARDARLDVGSDDAVKAWLNGKLVHANKASRPHTPFQDKVDVKLDAGWNTLLLKIVQGSGGWGFSCSVKAADGEAASGLKFQAEAPGK